MTKDSEKPVVEPDQPDAAVRSGKADPLRECSSPPCYAHEFPGYFGEIEEDTSKQQPPKKENG